LGYVLATTSDAHVRIDVSTLRSMHFMMLSHDLSKSPGTYRTGPIHVHDDATGETVYEGADSAEVADLMEELTAAVAKDPSMDPLIRGAMAHLDLVMIRPFRDGNGRMARALQTLVLSRCGVAEPAFSSIEEWLGSNTEDYYRVLAVTGGGRRQPDRDAALWVKFNLRAHHMQAHTTLRRFNEAVEIWAALDDLRARHGLPERVLDELYDAAIGFRIRRASYVKRAGIEPRTASRDLAALVELGHFRALGETKGRHYVAGPALRDALSGAVSPRRALDDPYPDLRAQLLRVRGAAGP
jgi:Fic family protein